MKYFIFGTVKAFVHLDLSAYLVNLLNSLVSGPWFWNQVVKRGLRNKRYL